MVMETFLCTLGVDLISISYTIRQNDTLGNSEKLSNLKVQFASPIFINHQWEKIINQLRN